MSKVLHSWISKLIRSFILLAFFAGSVTGQSKKEQIEVLNLRVDSLKNVVARQNHVNDSLRSLCKMQSNRIDSCLVQITLIKKNLKDSITSYKTALAQKDEANQKLNVQLASLQEAGGQAGPGKTVNFDLSDFTWDCYDFTFTQKKSAAYNPNDTGFTGQFVSYYSIDYSKTYSKNGSRLPYAVGNYVNGLKEGHWVYYLCDGSKQYEGDYRKGIRTGLWKNYDYCNKKFGTYLWELSTTLLYFQIHFQRRVECVEVCDYVNGIKKDTLKYYDLNNKLKYKVCIVNGNMFYDNNQLIIKGTPESGQVTAYYRNGQVCADVKYSGKISEDGFVVYEREGPTIEYYENGSIRTKGQYKNNSGVGQWFYYDRSGKLIRDFYEGDVDAFFECPCQ